MAILEPSNFKPKTYEPVTSKPQTYTPAENTPRKLNNNPHYSNWNRDWDDLGTIEKVFDILSRGQYASANVARGILENDTNLLGRAWDGLTGEEKGDFVDILRNHDVKWAPLLGTALNIGLDPFTYLGGPISLLKKGTTKLKGTAVGKALGPTTEDAIRNLDNVIKNNNIVKTLGEAFVPGFGVHKRIVEETNLAKYALSHDVKNSMKEVQDILGNITPEQGRKLVDWKLKGTIPKDEKSQELLHTALDWWDKATEKALEYRLITPEAIKHHTENGLSSYLPNVLYGHLDRWMPGKKLLTKTVIPGFAENRVTKFDINDWKYLSNQFSTLSELDSIPEIKSKAAELMANSRKIGDDAIFNNQSVKTIMSIIEDAGDDVGKVKKELHRLAVNYSPLDEMDKLMGVYNMNLAQAKHQDNLLNFVFENSKDADNWRSIIRDPDFVHKKGQSLVIRKNQVANVLDGIPEGQGSNTTKKLRALLKETRGDFFDMTRLREDTVREIMQDKQLANQLSVYALDDEVYDYLSKTEKYFGGKDPASNTILKWFDKVQGAWKRTATIYRLPFHMRNVVSNEAMMIQAGMSPADLIKYSKMAMYVQKGGKQKLKLGKHALTADEWKNLWSSKGVTGWGWIEDVRGSDIATETWKTMTGQANNTQKAIKDYLTIPAEKLRNLGVAIEDNARIATAMWSADQNMKAGADVAEALKEGALTSWKHLFQYDQLTDFEQSTMRRIFPFYTWLRKSIPRQIDNLVNRPQHTKNLGQFFNGLKQINPDSKREQELVPDYLKDMVHFKAPDFLRKAVGGKNDVYINLGLPWQDLARIAKPMETILQSLTPAMVLFNTGLNVTDFPHPGTRIEQFEGELVPAPWPATLLPEVTWEFLGVKPIKDKRTGKRVLGMPSKAANILYDALPPLRELNNMFKVTPDIEEEDAAWAKLRYVTGINFTPVDYNQQLQYKKMERQGKLSDVARRMNLLGRVLTQDELDEYF